MAIDIESILEEILNEGKPLGISDKENYRQFLMKELNGDELTNYLVVRATLGKDREGLLVYLLTSAKIIKIEIDKEKVQSVGSYLKEITGVSRTLLNNPAGNSAQVTVEFPQGSFGLRYAPTTGKIDPFFQKVDEAVRKIKVTTDGK